MRVLLAIARYDYGNPENGSSYEYNSWFRPLSELGHHVEVFDTFASAYGGDPTATGEALLAHARSCEPDLVMMMLIENEVSVDAIDRLRRSTVVVNWFADDTWRFRTFSRHIARHFSWVVTTSFAARDAYAKLPGVTAHFSTWGYDPYLYHPVNVEESIDVGFVGQRYGQRGAIVERLAAVGFSVVARGQGWPHGRLAAKDMAAEFARTKVNLNFLESSAGPFQRWGVRVRGSWRADQVIGRFVAPPTQLKARPFEVTACGAFLLTNLSPELGSFFRINEEVAAFRSERHLHEQIEYFLSNETERRSIAEAGRRRSASYTWSNVLTKLLARV